MHTARIEATHQLCLDNNFWIDKIAEANSELQGNRKALKDALRTANEEKVRKAKVMKDLLKVNLINYYKFVRL